jgi:hypothetical protein
VDVARQAEAMRIAGVNLAQAGDAKSVPHARRFARFLEGAGKSTAWCLALLQFDGVLDAEELKAVAADTRLAANAKAKAAVDKWLEKGLRCAAAETEQRMAAPTTADATLYRVGGNAFAASDTPGASRTRDTEADTRR